MDTNWRSNPADGAGSGFIKKAPLYGVGVLVMIGAMFSPLDVTAQSDIGFCPRSLVLWDESGEEHLWEFDPEESEPVRMHDPTGTGRADWSVLCFYESQRGGDRLMYSVQWLGTDYAPRTENGNLVPFPNYGCSEFTGQPKDTILSRTHEASVNWGVLADGQRYTGVRGHAEGLLEKAQDRAAPCDSASLGVCPGHMEGMVRYTRVGPAWNETHTDRWVELSCVYGPDDWSNVDSWSQGERTDLSWMALGWAESAATVDHWGCDGSMPVGPQYDDPAVGHLVISHPADRQAGVVLVTESEVKGYLFAPRDLDSSLSVASAVLENVGPKAVQCEVTENRPIMFWGVGVLLLFAAVSVVGLLYRRST